MSQDCPFAISPKAPVREGAHEEGEEEMADEEILLAVSVPGIAFQ